MSTKIPEFFLCPKFHNFTVYDCLVKCT